MNKDKIQIAIDNHNKYISKSPYNYIVLDNFFDDFILNKIVEDFPNPSEMTFYKYDNPLEKKLAYDRIQDLPNSIVNFLFYLNSTDFLIFLEELTGIKGLIPDPYFRGGGIHQIENGGKLDIHVDFNIHPKLNLLRRLNVIIYLNHNWKESWNGDFQVWSGGKDESGKHFLSELCERIYPLFNRMVIFSTSENSYHGHPEPLKCPKDITRKSIALYYYTNSDSFQDKHSTSFVKLPNEDNSLDELREIRNKGRISTNI